MFSKDCHKEKIGNRVFEKLSINLMENHTNLLTENICQWVLLKNSEATILHTRSHSTGPRPPTFQGLRYQATRFTIQGLHRNGLESYVSSHSALLVWVICSENSLSSLVLFHFIFAHLLLLWSVFMPVDILTQTSNLTHSPFNFSLLRYLNSAVTTFWVLIRSYYQPKSVI